MTTKARLIQFTNGRTRGYPYMYIFNQCSAFLNCLHSKTAMLPQNVVTQSILEGSKMTYLHVQEVHL